MKLIFLVIPLFFIELVFSQYESIGPVLMNQNLNQNLTINRSCNFDSTFIYFTDTISLPIFDEFSKDHFQKYSENFGDPTLTEEKYYKLLTESGELIPNSKKYTSQPTYKRSVNTTTLEVTETIFPNDTISVGDFCYYPPLYTTTFVYPPYILIDTVDFVNEIDTIWLTELEYIQDSATKFFLTLTDPNAYWLDNNVSHTFTNASLPWSLGTITFDGINSDGMPYEFGSNGNSYNDFFTSKPIFLGSLAPSDSIYLSFLYQSQGFNDEVETNDSLVLEFYAPLLDEWERIWSTSGEELNDFKVFHQKIIDTKYLKDGFQFRLKNYGSEAGFLDQFHVDYIHLRKFSGFQDTLFKDFALVYPVKSLLQDYTQVPWDHYKNSTQNLMNTEFEVTIRNSSNIVENNQNGNLNFSYQTIEEGTYTLIGQNLSCGEINYNPRSFCTSLHDLTSSSDFEFAKDKVGKFQEFNVILNASAQFPNLTQNDSTIFTQRFYDTYAYDDGSAEAAYGPEGVPNARLSYQFKSLESDSIIGMKIKFVPSVYDASQEIFYLSVWDDVNNKPGNLLYQDDFFNPRSPSYSYDDTLGFTNYYFTDTAKIKVENTFYIGWKQENVHRLNIGMDMNIDNKEKIFYSVDGESTWENTSFPGSLLMRPIFSTKLNADLAVDELENEFILKIFPNPSEGIYQLETSNAFLSYQIFDVKGQFIINSTEKNVDLSKQEKGVYFLKDLLTSKTYKLIKN
jgi:hypothetical protein